MIDLSEKYKVDLSAVSKIIKRKDFFLKTYASVENQSGNVNMRRVSHVTDSQFDNAMYMWFCQKRKLGEPRSGTLIQQQARLFHNRFYGESKFTASDGWLSKFKRRHNIRSEDTKSTEKLFLSNEYKFTLAYLFLDIFR